MTVEPLNELTNTMPTPTTFDFSAIGGFPIVKLRINIGMAPNGGMHQIPFVASEIRKLFIMPGKFARMEVLVAGKTIITEFALGSLGWEYER